MCQRPRECAVIVVMWWALSGGQAAQSANPAGAITVAGRVVDSQGEPVAGAGVTLVQMVQAEGAPVSDPKTIAEQSTAADGTFTLAIPPGADPQKTSYLVARRQGLAVGWVRWWMRGGRGLEISLGPAQDLVGEVLDESGQPVAEASVRVLGAVTGKGKNQKFLSKPEFLIARTDGNGRFLFADMPVEATFELTVEKSGWAAIDTLDRTRYMGNGYQFAPGQAGIRLVLPQGAGIGGIVVDKADGKPVGGVSVSVVPAARTIREAAPRPVLSAQDGTFHVGTLAPGTYIVQLTAPTEGMAAWAAEPVVAVLEAGQARNDIKLRLTQGGIIEVLVADKAGQPVGRARVNIHSIQSDEGFNAFTDTQGLARARVAPGQYIISNAFKEGYARRISQESITIGEGETRRMEHVLDSLPKIAGAVRDEAGHPLAGIKVTVVPMAMNETTTDPAGRFEATWNPLVLGAQDSSGILLARDATRDLAGSVDLDEDANNFDITVKPAVTVAGTVLDQEGTPLPGARVRVVLHGYRWNAPLGRGDAAAGPDGTFEVTTLPPDRQYTVTASANGYGEQSVLVDASNLAGSRYDAGQFRLAPANLSVTGIVVDPNDEPVAGANIQGTGEGQPTTFRMQPVQTDAEGKFTVKGLCAGVVRLIVNSRGPTRLYGFAEVEAGATDVKVVLSERPSGPTYTPRRPASLQGKSLPPLSGLGIDLPAEAEGKRLLVCFWDLGQRPSRYCITQLAARAAQLAERGVTIVGVQAAKVEEDALNQWIETNKVPFRMGRIAAEVDKTWSTWGVVSLPHLILTDDKHIVVAEGFPLSDLDPQIEATAERQ